MLWWVFYIFLYIYAILNTKSSYILFFDSNIYILFIISYCLRLLLLVFSLFCIFSLSNLDNWEISELYNVLSDVEEDCWWDDLFLRLDLILERGLDSGWFYLFYRLNDRLLIF
jgi:hypothetical protein